MAQKNAAPGGEEIVQVAQVGSVSPHNRAIYEAGKTMLIESVQTGREFCKFMITSSTGAIPLYLGILTFVFPLNYRLGILAGALVAGPAIIFLVAALVFALGYFPATDYFSLDIIEEIEKARSKVIQRRKKLAQIGFTLFMIATLYAIVVIVINIGVR